MYLGEASARRISETRFFRWRNISDTIQFPDADNTQIMPVERQKYDAPGLVAPRTPRPVLQVLYRKQWPPRACTRLMSLWEPVHVPNIRTRAHMLVSFVFNIKIIFCLTTPPRAAIEISNFWQEYANFYQSNTPYARHPSLAIKYK